MPDSTLAGYQPTGAPQQGGSPPPYVDLSDPVQAAVWQSFQQKGIQPRDQGDFNYWVDHINQSGGLENGYANAGGTGTWQQRMAAASGGVGDYGAGDGGGAAGGSGGGANGFQYSPSAFVSGPFGQYALKEAQNAVNSNLFSRGLGLSTGAAKDIAGATYGALGSLIPQDYAMQSGQFQQNFGNLATLAGYGMNATNAAAGYNTGAAAAGAAGTVGSANAINSGINNAGNAASNYALYRQANPSAPQNANSVRTQVNDTQNKVLSYDGSTP